jgi:hypothetical protein
MSRKHQQLPRPDHASNSLNLINEAIRPSPNITWVALTYTLGLSISFLIVGRLSNIFAGADSSPEETTLL